LADVRSSGRGIRTAWRSQGCERTPKQTRIGEAGIALIHERVGEMGHNWQPTGGPDSGIDGEIELVDPATDVTRHFRLGVQSKATEG
jgi:Domain of unknown function (DUF4365)